jgi:hypothetical protein
MLVPKKERLVDQTVTRKTRNGEWAEQELSRRRVYLNLLPLVGQLVTKEKRQALLA